MIQNREICKGPFSLIQGKEKKKKRKEMLTELWSWQWKWGGGGGEGNKNQKTILGVVGVVSIKLGDWLVVGASGKGAVNTWPSGLGKRIDGRSLSDTEAAEGTGTRFMRGSGERVSLISMMLRMRCQQSSTQTCLKGMGKASQDCSEDPLGDKKPLHA